jgi:uncharacterized SAM-binding protein YcdF (DUF218 family)
MQSQVRKSLDRILPLARNGALAFVVLYLIVTFTPVVKWLVSAMDQDWADGDGEVLVVLSGSMLVGGSGPDATLGSSTYLRCVYASWILRQHSFHTIVVTGTDGAAAAMARFLEQQGVPAGSILQEPRAASTWENAVYTRDLLNDHYRTATPPPVVVLTSDYHSWRARRVFQKAGLSTKTIAIPDALKQVNSPLNRWNIFLALLSEWAKDLDYALQGRL